MRQRGLPAGVSARSDGRGRAHHRAPGIDAREGTPVRDLRDRLWASIDNDDSRDLDQLSVAEPLQGDAVKVLVAIADVDALVAQHSAIDRHAATNTTSVYTAAQVFPMLPRSCRRT
jgi:exoribonuclease-2